MKKINLTDNTSIYCLKSSEALVLDEHIKGYLSYGIKIKNSDTVIDVGANIGVLGVRLSQYFKDITIHSFEPIPTIYNVLSQNAQLTLNKNFYTYMIGISNHNKELEFTYFPNSPALSTSKPEIWKQDQKNFISAVQGNITHAPKEFWWAKFIPKFTTPLIAKYLTHNSQKIKSHVITLSSFISKYNINQIDLLKIDCEGEELNVLLGIKQSDWPLIKSIIMEVNDVDSSIEKTKLLLSKNGFTKITIEKEKGFEETKLVNIYASR
jgi:FkbM family methyltransferase